MNYRLLLVAPLVVVAMNCVHAQSFLKDGMPFSSARKLPLQNGWTPFDLYPKGQLSEVVTQEAMLIKNGIREVDLCSMDAGSICNFFTKREMFA